MRYFATFETPTQASTTGAMDESGGLGHQGATGEANAQYWPPTNVMGELQRPAAIAKPTCTQLTWLG